MNASGKILNDQTVPKDKRAKAIWGDKTKNKITSLEQELNKKSEIQEKFSREIDELSQETEELVEEIDKWQM